MRIAQQEKFLKLSEEIIHMSVVLGEDSDANLAEWRDVETCLTEERRLAFTQKKNELNRAMVKYSINGRDTSIQYSSSMY